MKMPVKELRLEELSTRLPLPTADDRVEVYDAVRGRVVTFPGHVPPPLGHPPNPRGPRVPPAKLFSRQVWSAAVLKTGVAAFERERELPRELAFGSYWGRAVFSGDGRHLYLTGPFNTRSVYVSAVDPQGRLGPWRATRPLPPSQDGRRSLHQVFVAGSRLHVLGGWFADGSPGLRQIHSAPLGPDGALGDFRLSAPLLPFSHAAFSIARCGPRLYLARGDTIWSATLQKDGALSPFQRAASNASLKHEDYGGSGMACCGSRLVLADEAQTHVFDLATGGALRHVGSLSNPAPFKRRTVFCHNSRFFITTTHDGRIYLLHP